ncbi:HNH endonuclease [Tolumonas lignilytica]|uniref:HNH endonuclease n=1 Tax=Tolumonas lignilytica TaxID=1283284 RepID=UPI0004662B8A|nr:HNH endonuclease [Tolumonas lignilytica]
MLNSIEIEKLLIKYGFTQHIKHERINGFKIKNIKHPIYTKTPDKKSKQGFVAKSPLVIHSNYQSLKHDLDKISGIEIDWDNFYHNSNLKGFELRSRKGKKDIEFGININISHEKSLNDLINYLASNSTGNGDSDVDIATSDNPKNTTGSSTQNTRIGQDVFRAKLVSYWGKCAVSNVTNQSLLRASHIKPWCESTDTERLDVYNGLLLNPTLDLLFELGYISFDAAGFILLSEKISDQISHLHLTNTLRLEKIELGHHEYLDWHRKYKFQG